MDGTHEALGFVEIGAALILSIGGALLLVRATLERRAIGRRRTLAAADPYRASGLDTVPGSAPADSDISSRTGAWVAAGLSAGAAAIHFAAGPEHVEALGDIGLGFYWAALFQAATALALLGHRQPRRVAWMAIVGNLLILGAWVVSRSIGLPTVPGGPESIGVADGVTALLQAALVGLLAARLRGFDLARALGPRSDGLRTALTGGLVASLGVIALSTLIAVNAAAASHGHEGDPMVGASDHAMPGVMVEADHGHGATTAP